MNELESHCWPSRRPRPALVASWLLGPLVVMFLVTCSPDQATNGPPPATQLRFTVQPSKTWPVAAITPAVQVTALDGQGNTAIGFTGNVTVAVGTNPGGATLSGTMTAAAENGVATFGNLTINHTGAGYTLTASAAQLAGASSNPFDIPAPFGHIFIVVEENTNCGTVMGDTSMPYLNSLAGRYGLGTQYYANTHPSIGNYFMLTVGDTITNNDSYSGTVSQDNVVRELVAAGKTWKSYAEDLPYVGDTAPGVGNYARKHNPFAFLSDVRADTAQAKNIVPFTQFSQDLTAGTLPNYAMIIPNLCNDAHDCPLSTADAWLAANIDPLIKSALFQQDGLLVILFDESGSDNTNGGGRICWVAVSPKAKRGYQSTTLYQHQSTLRLSLQGLGVTVFPNAAATAPAPTEFFLP